MKFRVILAFLVLFSSMSFSFPFKKKVIEDKPHIPSTVEEYDEESKSIPLSERDILPDAPLKSDKKNYYPKPEYVYELYNYPQGSIEYNISTVKKNLVYHPIMVVDKTFSYVAYTNYYYSSDNDMIYSDFYIGELDKSKSKINRVLEFSHKKNPLNPAIIAGVDEYYPHLYKGLTIVDWNNNSDKVLVKERVGSTIEGIYRTYLYIFDLNTMKAKKLKDFNSYIENYMKNRDKISIHTLKYDLTPLGFSQNNDDIIICELFLYTKEGEKLFVGLWGYDTKNNKTILLSEKNSSYPISTNGLVLKQVLE